MYNPKGHDIVDYRKRDEALILAFLKERSSETILVKDVKCNSGAEQLRVDPILFDMEQAGIIEVVERRLLGAPVTIKYK